MSDALIEAAARGMWSQIELVGKDAWTWESQPAALRATWLGHASRAIAAIGAAGYAVVPRAAPNAAILVGANELEKVGAAVPMLTAISTWNAMIAAAEAPAPPPQEGT